jgi:two-component system, sensor histidine kinase and response regulator
VAVKRTKTHSAEITGLSKENLRGRRILVAEDSVDTQELTKILLTRVGAEAYFANNGQEVLDSVRSSEPEAILMDLQMPVKDGYEATRDLRNRGYHGPIIALTAYALAEVRERCFTVGMDDFLTKPVDPQQLYSCLMRHLNSKPHRAAEAASP